MLADLAQDERWADSLAKRLEGSAKRLVVSIRALQQEEHGG